MGGIVFGGQTKAVRFAVKAPPDWAAADRSGDGLRIARCELQTAGSRSVKEQSFGIVLRYSQPEVWDEKMCL